MGNDWTVENNNHPNGLVLAGTGRFAGLTCFEDRQERNARFYAWRGTFADHDGAQHFDGSDAEAAFSHAYRSSP